MFCKIKSIDISTLSGISKLKGELLLWILYPTNQMKHWSINTIRIPQELFVNKKYKNKLNSDSKILYAFLLDRLSLSQKNHWIDEDNNVISNFYKRRSTREIEFIR